MALGRYVIGFLCLAVLLTGCAGNYMGSKRSYLRYKFDMALGWPLARSGYWHFLGHAYFPKVWEYQPKGDVIIDEMDMGVPFTQINPDSYGTSPRVFFVAPKGNLCEQEVFFIIKPRKVTIRDHNNIPIVSLKWIYLPPHVLSTRHLEAGGMWPDSYLYTLHKLKPEHAQILRQYILSVPKKYPCFAKEDVAEPLMPFFLASDIDLYESTYIEARYPDFFWKVYFATTQRIDRHFVIDREVTFKYIGKDLGDVYNFDFKYEATVYCTEPIVIENHYIPRVKAFLCVDKPMEAPCGNKPMTVIYRDFRRNFLRKIRGKPLEERNKIVLKYALRQHGTCSITYKKPFKKVIYEMIPTKKPRPVVGTRSALKR